MQFVSCGKGHYYNPEEHATCPQCARENAGLGGGFNVSSVGVTEPVGGGFGGGMDSVGKTEPVGGFGGMGGGMDPIGTTEPVGGFGNFGGGMGGAPVAAPGSPLNTTFFRDETISAGKVQDYGPTQFASPEFTSTTPNSAESQIQPVVGWLVCVNGSTKGRDFRIHAQYNYIGRARHMDICIEGDTTISSEQAAILAYDDQQKMFFFAPSQGRNLVRLNGKAVLSPVELQAYDRLSIGKSEFLFIPLCGERFDWNEKEAE